MIDSSGLESLSESQEIIMLQDSYKKMCLFTNIVIYLVTASD